MYSFAIRSPRPLDEFERDQLTALQAAWDAQADRPDPPTMAQHLHRFARGIADAVPVEATGTVYQILMSLPWDGCPGQGPGITAISFFPDGSMAGCFHDTGRSCQFRPVYLSRGFDRYKPRFSPYAQGPEYTAADLTEPEAHGNPLS